MAKIKDKISSMKIKMPGLKTLLEKFLKYGNDMIQELHSIRTNSTLQRKSEVFNTPMALIDDNDYPNQGVELEIEKLLNEQDVRKNSCKTVQ